MSTSHSAWRAVIVSAALLSASGCGGAGSAGTATTDVAPADPPSEPTQSSTQTPATAPSEPDADPALAPDPCALFTTEELETAAGFALDDGTFIDLADSGISGATCFYEGQETDSGNVSSSVITGSMAAGAFDDLAADGGVQLGGFGDRAWLSLGDVQSNVYVQTGEILAGVDIVHASGTRPGDAELEQRLLVLARIVAEGS